MPLHAPTAYRFCVALCEAGVRWEQRVDLQLIALGDPAETREFVKGSFEVYRVGPMTLGRANDKPG
jgi:hypothetical protein